MTCYKMSYACKCGTVGCPTLLRVRHAVSHTSKRHFVRRFLVHACPTLGFAVCTHWYSRRDDLAQTRGANQGYDLCWIRVLFGQIVSDTVEELIHDALQETKSSQISKPHENISFACVEACCLTAATRTLAAPFGLHARSSHS